MQLQALLDQRPQVQYLANLQDTLSQKNSAQSTIQRNGDNPSIIWTDRSLKLANEKLPEMFKDTGALYQGVLFRFQVRTESGALAKGRVKEYILPVSDTGIFESLPSTAQSRAIELDNGVGWDANVLTVGGGRQEGEARVSGPEVAESTGATTGESTVLQYFVYVDEDGGEHLIKNSGYRITKNLEPGKLTVTREAEAFETDHGSVEGGLGEIGDFEIDI